MLNRDMLGKELDEIIRELSVVRNLLVCGDREGLCEKMRQPTQRRTAFDREK